MASNRFSILNKGLFASAFLTAMFAAAPLLHAQDQYDTMIEEALSNIENAGENLPAGSGSQVALDSFEVEDHQIEDVLKLIAAESGLRIVVDEEIEGRVTLYVNQVNPYDLLRVVLSEQGLAYREENGAVHVMRQETYRKRYGDAFNKDVDAKIMDLKHARAIDLLPQLNALKSEAGKIIYIARDNRLIVIDTPLRVSEIAKAMGTLDVPALPKVTIAPQKSILKAKVIQVLLTEEYLKGVDWEAIVSNYQHVSFQGFDRESGARSTLSVGTVSQEDYTILLDALDTVGPIVNVYDEELPVFSDAPINVLINEVDLYPSSDQREEEFLKGTEKVRFHLVSSAENEGAIDFKITPELIGPKWSTSKPVATDEKAVVISINSQDTIVIGGLFKEVKVTSQWKVPLLGDLPLLRYAFRTQGQARQKTEVITFLTPKLIEEE